MDLSPLWISLKTALVATAIVFFLGILLARARLAFDRRLGGVLDAALLLPIALPPTVLGLILLVVFGRQSPVGALLAGAGLPIVFSWLATVITAVSVALPLMYFAARGAFTQIDGELLDVARTYGYSEWQILWRLMVPMAWPGILAGALLAFVRGLGEFGATLMLAGNIPGRTETIPIAIYFRVEAGDLAGAFLLSGVIMTISIAAAIILSRVRF